MNIRQVLVLYMNIYVSHMCNNILVPKVDILGYICTYMTMILGFTYMRLWL